MPSGPGPKLLLVEDHVDTREAMAVILSRSGFDVTAVSTVADALGALAGQECVVLDLMLPDGSGLEILRRLRAEYPGVRPVVLSATSDVTVLYEAMELSPHVFLKPIPMHDLLECLSKPASTMSARDGATGDGVTRE